MALEEAEFPTSGSKDPSSSEKKKKENDPFIQILVAIPVLTLIAWYVLSGTTATLWLLYVPMLILTLVGSIIYWKRENDNEMYQKLSRVTAGLMGLVLALFGRNLAALATSVLADTWLASWIFDTDSIKILFNIVGFVAPLGLILWMYTENKLLGLFSNFVGLCYGIIIASIFLFASVDPNADRMTGSDTVDDQLEWLIEYMEPIGKGEVSSYEEFPGEELQKFAHEWSKDQECTDSDFFTSLRYLTVTPKVDKDDFEESFIGCVSCVKALIDADKSRLTRKLEALANDSIFMSALLSVENKGIRSAGEIYSLLENLIEPETQESEAPATTTPASPSPTTTNPAPLPASGSTNSGGAPATPAPTKAAPPPPPPPSKPKSVQDLWKKDTTKN